MSYVPRLEILEDRLAPSAVGVPDDPIPLPLSRAFPPERIRLVQDVRELLPPPAAVPLPPLVVLPPVALPPDLRLLGKDVPAAPPRLAPPARELLPPPADGGPTP